MNRMLLGSSVRVDDGKPHTVSVSRNGQSGLISLTVDQGNPSQTVVNQIPGQELQTMDVFLGRLRSTLIPLIRTIMKSLLLHNLIY